VLTSYWSTVHLKPSIPIGVQIERALPPPIVPASKILYKLVIILISTYYFLHATSALRQKSSHFYGINSHSEIFHFLLKGLPHQFEEGEGW
jgi:hypothetical protein